MYYLVGEAWKNFNRNRQFGYLLIYLWLLQNNEYSEIGKNCFKGFKFYVGKVKAYFKIREDRKSRGFIFHLIYFKIAYKGSTRK